MLDMHTAVQDLSSITTRPVSFPAGGASVHGQLFLPPATPVAALVLNGATGVPHGYYRHFAQWLATERNIACLTYDYRDFGESAQIHPRESTATMSDWALIDQPAARAEMRRHLPGVPLWVMGHSLGGMLMPMQDGIDDVARMIGAASGIVYHKDHPWPYQALARMFWFGHGPLAVRMAGYLPGKRLGFGADLPASVYWEWRDWCTSRNGFFPLLGGALPNANWGRSDAPVDLFAFTDDQLCPPKSVRKLAGLYGVARVRQHVVAPQDHGLKDIGHLGAFARKNAALWPRLIDMK